MDWIHVGVGPRGGSCNYENGNSGFTKSLKFLDQINDYDLFKIDSAM
jgi:hypothetical protein